MKTTEIDSAKIAYTDVTNPAFAHVAAGTPTPGLRQIADIYGIEKKVLDQQLSATNTNLEIRRDALAIAQAHSLPNIAVERDALLAAHEAEKALLEEKLNTSIDELKKFQQMEASIGIPYRSVAQSSIEKAPVSSSLGKKNTVGSSSVKYKATGWLTLLVGICVFDAINTYQALSNFENNPLLIIAVSLICFGLVLASALWVKAKPSMSTWVWFILFLCFANLPLTYGRAPLFDISRLWLSPFTLTRFLISFIGSLFITFKLMVKIPALLASEVSLQPMPVPETKIDPKKLQWELLVQKIQEKEAAIESIKAGMIANQACFETNVAGLDKKVEEQAALQLQAIETLRSELAAFENQKERLETDLASLASLFEQKKQEYHAEVELLRIIHGIN